MQAGTFREKGFWLSSLLALMILALAFPSVAQDDNYCRTEISEIMEIGDTLTGSITSNIPFAFYCFEGERGDTITVTVEATDDRLIPVVFITDPVFDEEDLQNPLGVGVANRAGGTAEAVFEIDATSTYLIVVVGDINTLGTFEISLDAEGRSILGSTEEPTDEPGEEPTDEPGEDPTDEPDDTGSGDEVIDFGDIEFGDDNLCRVDGVQELAYGETVTGELDEFMPFYFYCFEASEGDVVRLEAGTESGDAVMVILVVEPFFDYTENTIYTGAQARNRNSSAEIEFVVPEDGDYVVWVQVSEEGEEGEYYLTIEGEAGTVFDCTNEPLASLVSQQWAIVSENPEEALIHINVSCDGQIAVSAMGVPQVGFYDINQDGELIFVYGNALFTTVSLDAESWTIADDEGNEYQFVPVPDTNCSEESVAALINGSWALETREGEIIFSFTCNGIFFVGVPQQPSIAGEYTFEDGELSLNYVDGTVLVFEDVVIEDDELTATYDGDEFVFENALAD